jgi:hypothetical protein
MKTRILIFLCAIMLLSCKEDNTEPVPFRIFTRSPVLMSGSTTTYMLKGTAVTEGGLEIYECGFIYTQNASQNNNLPNYNNPTGTIRQNIYINGKLPPGNFEMQVLLVSGQIYYIAAFAKVHNRKTGQDEVITGSHVQLNVP